MKPQVLRSISELQAWRDGLDQNLKLGFVPTMGALHAGHGELLRQAKAGSDIVILSIFVNPTQFNDPKDFEKYPNTLEQDLAMAEEYSVDAVFLPTKEMLYPDQYSYKITETQQSLDLCGATRPGHFDGVLSIVMKLFNLVRPNLAYFGEKDFQQLSLIKGMIDAFFLPIALVPVATVRESSGLAMSSRNQRLSLAEKEKAALIYKLIRNKDLSLTDISQQLLAQGFKLDYIKDLRGRRYIAAFLGEVRLIDNVEI